jgi:hypothetical protein
VELARFFFSAGALDGRVGPSRALEIEAAASRNLDDRATSLPSTNLI